MVFLFLMKGRIRLGDKRQKTYCVKIFVAKCSDFRRGEAKIMKHIHYMLNNFCKAVAEIWKLQQKNLYAVGL